MLVRLCDRCGRETKQDIPYLYCLGKKGDSFRSVNGEYYFPLFFCNNCINEFETDFRHNHPMFNNRLIKEDKIK